MKKIIPLFVAFCICWQSKAQNFTAFEYFFTTDPGVGLATAITGVPTGNNLNFTATITPPANLQSGLHFLCIRGRTASGSNALLNRWSVGYSMPVLIFPASIGTANSAGINRMEFFLGNDPGFGSASGVNIAPDVNGNVVAPITIPSGLAAGFYMMAYRVRTNVGQWSNTTFLPMVIFPASTGTANSAGINRMEYFFGNDPGFGSGNGVNIMPDANGNVVAPIVIPNGQTPGFYMMAYRVRTGFGQWSVTQLSPFIVWSNTINPNNSPIVKLEYYIDSDPGNGLGKNIIFTPNPSVDIQTAINLDLAGLSQGDHVIYVRALDEQGHWSSPQSAVVNIRCTNGVTLFTAQTGNWHQTSSWACGRVPTSTDNVIIKNSHTISVSVGNTASCRNFETKIGAVLNVPTGAKLNLRPN